VASANGNTEVVLALLAKGAKLEAADQVLCVRPLYRRCVCICVCECVCVCVCVCIRVHTRTWGGCVYVVPYNPPMPPYGPSMARMASYGPI
jgi:hypothetical protein